MTKRFTGNFLLSLLVFYTQFAITSISAACNSPDINEETWSHGRPWWKVAANKHQHFSCVTAEQRAETCMDCLSPQDSSSEETGGTLKSCNWGPRSANTGERKWLIAESYSQKRRPFLVGAKAFDNPDRCFQRASSGVNLGWCCAVYLSTSRCVRECVYGLPLQWRYNAGVSYLTQEDHPCRQQRWSAHERETSSQTMWTRSTDSHYSYSYWNTL